MENIRLSRATYQLIERAVTALSPCEALFDTP